MSADLFARNLDHLLRLRSLSRKSAAEAIGVPYKWLRRAVTQGIGSRSSKNNHHLEIVTAYFSLAKVDDLWRHDLIEIQIAHTRKAVREGGTVPTRMETCLAELSFLLRSGNHDYLYQMIADAYTQEQAGQDTKRKQTGYHQFPVIKWQGSKRRQAPSIVEQFPRSIRTYYEPFVGSGAVLSYLLRSKIAVDAFRCSDTCVPLIGIWTLIKSDPESLYDHYQQNWLKLRAIGEQHFYDMRESFNQTQNPCELFFLLRTSRLGHVRFNLKGHFTSAIHRGGGGVVPHKLKVPLDDLHKALNSANVQFSVQDYSAVTAGPGDLLYLDPPYPTNEVYYGRMNFQAFYSWLESQEGNYLLSLSDGASVPRHLYDECKRLDAGCGPFARIQGQEAPPLYDALYIRRCSATRSLVG